MAYNICSVAEPFYHFVVVLLRPVYTDLNNQAFDTWIFKEIAGFVTTEKVNVIPLTRA
jgi:hypothetical protein